MRIIYFKTLRQLQAEFFTVISILKDQIKNFSFIEDSAVLNPSLNYVDSLKNLLMKIVSILSLQPKTMPIKSIVSTGVISLPTVEARIFNIGIMHGHLLFFFQLGKPFKYAFLQV
jgi:hypothetical protein